jgi:hypothetical protein
MIAAGGGDADVGEGSIDTSASVLDAVSVGVIIVDWVVLALNVVGIVVVVVGGGGVVVVGDGGAVVDIVGMGRAVVDMARGVFCIRIRSRGGAVYLRVVNIEGCEGCKCVDKP